MQCGAAFELTGRSGVYQPAALTALSLRMEHSEPSAQSAIIESFRASSRTPSDSVSAANEPLAVSRIDAGVNADANMNARDRYVERLIEGGSAIALPELRASRLPDAVYQVRDRCGLGAVAIPETAFDEHQLDALARFRFAQYMASGYVDKDVAFRERLDQCPLATYTSPGTVHFVVFAAATGELLATMCMVGPPPAASDVRVATRNRPLLPVEEQFGWGPFNRLNRIPDTPIERMRDYGRLVKNLRHPDAGRARSSSSSWRRCVWGSERGPAPSTWLLGSSSRHASSATSSSSTSRSWCCEAGCRASHRAIH